MTSYRYSARALDGTRVSGMMVADSAATVVAHLRSRALYVTAVDEAGTLAGTVMAVRAASSARTRGSAQTAVATFFRSFATLVGAGVPMHRALEVTIEQCADARLRETLRAVHADVEHGNALSTAMRSRGEFPPLTVAMVEAGETGGVLDEVLERIATLSERERALRKQIIAALMYPALVLCAAVVLVLFLIATIVPTFATMFTQLRLELPLSTRILIALGGLLRDPSTPAALGGFACAAAACAALAIRVPAITALRDQLLLRLPIVGELTRKAIVARVARTLGTLLRSGVGLLRAIEVVAPVSGNAAYAAALRSLHGALREGDSVADPLAGSRLFDPLAIQLVRVGEETGALDAMLIKIAEYYETDVEAALATAGAMLEPVLVGSVGTVVGLVVFSLFIPLYSLIGALH